MKEKRRRSELCEGVRVLVGTQFADPLNLTATEGAQTRYVNTTVKFTNSYVSS
jgi:hypothetical protein